MSMSKTLFRLLKRGSFEFLHEREKTIFGPFWPEIKSCRAQVALLLGQRKEIKGVTVYSRAAVAFYVPACAGL